MSDDVLAIERLSHSDGRIIYLPKGQASPDTAQTLERDGLIQCQYDERGKYVSTFVHDPAQPPGALLAAHGQLRCSPPRPWRCF